MERKDYHVDGLVVTRVVADYEDVNSVVLYVNKEIQTINVATDEDTMSKKFSMQKQAITEQLKELMLEEAMEADYYIDGFSYTFDIIQAILLHSTIDIERIYKEKGTLREYKKEGDKNSIYTSNMFTTRLTGVKVCKQSFAVNARTKAYDKADKLKEEARKVAVAQATDNGAVKPPFGHSWGF